MRRLYYLMLCGFLATPLAAASADDVRDAPGVDDLAFIAGDWEGELFGGLAEESWMPPRGGTMVGTFRLVWPESGRRLYELLLIEERNDGVVELAFRHFDTRMELWKREVEAPLRFVLVEVGPRRAVFDAEDRSQEPARFVFETDEAGTGLTVTVASFDEEGAVRESFEAVYGRVRRR